MRLGRGYGAWQKIHGGYVFLSGFLIGIVLMNVAKQNLLIETGLFDEYVLYRMKYTVIDANAFFWYAFEKRMGVLLTVTLLSMTLAGILAIYGLFLWAGFSFGMIISAVIIRYGLKGCMLIMIGVFPHFLFYVPACILLAKWCMEIRDNPGEARSRKIMNWLMIFGVVIIGLILESYVNPKLVSNLLKIF